MRMVKLYFVLFGLIKYVLCYFIFKTLTLKSNLHISFILSILVNDLEISIVSSCLTCPNGGNGQVLQLDGWHIFTASLVVGVDKQIPYV